jgi:hypothetical protein
MDRGSSKPYVQVTKEGVDVLNSTLTPQNLNNRQETDSDSDSDSDEGTDIFNGDTESDTGSDTESDTQSDTGNGQDLDGGAIDISKIEAVHGGNSTDIDASSTVSTTELLGKDPLFLVLSEFLMDEEGNNIVHALQKVNKNLSKIVKLLEKKKSSHTTRKSIE